MPTSNDQPSLTFLLVNKLHSEIQFYPEFVTTWGDDVSLHESFQCPHLRSQFHVLQMQNRAHMRTWSLLCNQINIQPKQKSLPSTSQTSWSSIWMVSPNVQPPLKSISLCLVFIFPFQPVVLKVEFARHSKSYMLWLILISPTPLLFLHFALLPSIASNFSKDS